ncbi:hypothetical protein B0O80DRAFT_430660 [Mortierella sp. GBAus27b]|nr:hypothetical protein B0O80DRAFT_430660 [Mortierella sp. GBAus27b]
MDRIQRGMNTGDNVVQIWKHVVKNNFSRIWDTSEKDAARQKSTGAKLVKGKTVRNVKHINDFEDPPSDPNASTVDIDDTKDLHTCTATLKQLIQKIIEEKQHYVTDDMAQLSIIAHKHVDITTLLPEGFEPRSIVPTTINVAPIPQGLQNRIEIAQDRGADSATDQDIAKILSQEHLQYQHFTFMGVRGTNEGSEINRPVWKLSADAIKNSTDTIKQVPKAVAQQAQQRTKPQDELPSNNRASQRKLKRLCDDLSDVLESGDNERISRRLPVLFAQLSRAKQQKGTQRSEAISRKEASDEIGPDDKNEDLLFGDLPEGEEDSTKEPSRSRLKALQTVLKTLPESPFIHTDIKEDDVREASFARSDFTSKECQVVAKLVNTLRPFTPKRRPDKIEGTRNPIPYITLQAPLVMISNAVLRATGPNQFDIVGADGLPLTNRDQVLEYPGAKRAVTGAFFDLAKIEKLCHKHGLEFKDRIVILELRRELYDPEATIRRLRKECYKWNKISKAPSSNGFSQTVNMTTPTSDHRTYGLRSESDERDGPMIEENFLDNMKYFHSQSERMLRLNEPLAAKKSIESEMDWTLDRAFNIIKRSFGTYLTTSYLPQRELRWSYWRGYVGDEQSSLNP